MLLLSRAMKVLVAEVRNGGRNSSKISDYLIALRQAKVGNEARLVITFLLVIMVVMAVAGMLAAAARG